MGVGRKLTDEIIGQAKKKRYSTIYLLCTDAESFFASCGFKKLAKNKAPIEVKQTKQFTEICSDSAVVMKIQIPNSIF
tara:strand:- start:197 stop:430 length:234 start_codon:yes stop_codon:yes gene_type:complete